VIFLVLTVPVTVWLAGWEASPGGATPGKRLLGLRVLTSSGDRPSWPRSLLRTALKFTLPWELAHTHNRCQPGPMTAPAHQEFRHRWIQAKAEDLVPGVP
jgi:hypothetical protein